MPTINEAAVLRFYVDTQGYSDRLTAIEAQAASSIATHKTDVAAAIAQVNLTQSQTITALTLEVNNLKTSLTASITATQTELINKADQLRTELTDIAQQLTQDNEAITQEIQDALDYLKDDASVASALRTPRKIQGVDFDGTQDISLPTFTTQTDGLVPKRVGTTSTKYLREDGTWVEPSDTTYALLTTANAEAGTATTANSISAKVLKEAIQYHAPTVINIAGNAGTATKLQTARTIGGVSFDGTANINLPGVNTAGNQSTSGNAATTTKLQTARSIAISGAVTGTATGFDGSANIAIATTAINGSQISTGIIPAARIPTLNQSTTGNAGSATKLQTARLINGIAFDGTGDINLDVYSKAETNSIATTPSATETTAGKAKIATTAIAQAGTNDTDFLTAKKLRDALNAEGAAPISACRAWVCFDSTTEGAVIRASDNIQSIVRTSTGKFVITFVGEMPHSDYIVLTGTRADSPTGSTLNLVVNEAFNVSTQNAKTTKTLSVMYASTSSLYDSYGISLGVVC